MFLSFASTAGRELGLQLKSHLFCWEWTLLYSAPYLTCLFIYLCFSYVSTEVLEVCYRTWHRRRIDTSVP